MIRRYAVALCAAFALAPQAQGQSIDTPDAGYSGQDYDSPAYDVSYETSDYASQNYDAGGYNSQGGLPAAGREVIGHGRLTTNDLLGDGNDRWQTGSVSASRVVGRGGWNGMLPARPFDILEYRLGVQVIAPENLRSPAKGDRAWAGALSLGIHTHFMRGPVELSMGADLVAVGPQTGLSAFQTAFHDTLGVTSASKSVVDNQIGNAVYPTMVLEAGNTMGLGGQVVLRPFVEARAGVETMVRIGADMAIGSVGQGELLVRDTVTGQRYRAVSNPLGGFSYIVGGDMAYVSSSAYLPESDGYELAETRNRLRAGLHWQGDRNAAFYGVTWLSKESKAQDGGQTVGSVRLDFKF